jgi:hypothetical protein
MPFEGNQRSDRNVEVPKLLGAAEFGQVDDETGRDDLGAHLAQKFHRAFRRRIGTKPVES